jgi:hypothetical protein
MQTSGDSSEFAETKQLLGMVLELEFKKSELESFVSEKVSHAGPQ